METIRVLGQREREAKPAIQQVTPVCEHSQAALRLYGPRREERKSDGDLEPSAGFPALYRLLLVISGPTS